MAIVEKKEEVKEDELTYETAPPKNILNKFG